VERIYERTVRSLVLDGAERWPDREVFAFDHGAAWTRQDLLSESCRAANALAERGIGTGDPVALFMDNGPGLVRAWLGAAMAGAVVVPMNVGYRGRVLRDVCGKLQPGAVVVDAGYRERFSQAGADGPVLVDPGELAGDNDRVPDVSLAPSDVHALLLTSGTTGGSKASRSTHAYMLYVGRYLADPRTGLGEGDVFLADLPFCHLSSLAPSIQMLCMGGKVVVRDRPDLKNYWATASRWGATFSILAGTMAELLLTVAPTERDRAHSLRFVLASPLPSDPAAFCERFGVKLMTAYGLTEGSIVCVKYPDDEIPPGSCGRPRPEVELRIVDEHDMEVPAGAPGELLIRNRLPWVTGQGYVGDDPATVALWKNQWLHTGDVLHADAEGHYYFHDRLKDSLRRRGENISSWEVEREVLAYPTVLEAACVASVQELGADDEVKVFIVPRPGATVDFPDLLAFLADRMPHYMVPRYLELIDEFPKTPSARVRKGDLRTKGNTAATWDRDTAGYRVSRAGLERPEGAPRSAAAAS